MRCKEEYAYRDTPGNEIRVKCKPNDYYETWTTNQARYPWTSPYVVTPTTTNPVCLPRTNCKTYAWAESSTSDTLPWCLNEKGERDRSILEVEAGGNCTVMCPNGEFNQTFYCPRNTYRDPAMIKNAYFKCEVT